MADLSELLLLLASSMTQAKDSLSHRDLCRPYRAPEPLRHISIPHAESAPNYKVRRTIIHIALEMLLLTTASTMRLTQHENDLQQPTQHRWYSRVKSIGWGSECFARMSPICCCC
uniref:Secreted protein n=1 Tax=Grammatophora oceanica TaxID=210454 RepID=A0A7S1YIG6_9STRA|mmetsp:Transcript_48359/g.72113  ORF Transcript_48359/g.72113 Transcript_48359/m.72113 type:complete len:115 (+) Transcript_48359:395-739(+)